MTVQDARNLRTAGRHAEALAVLDTIEDQGRIDVLTERFHACFARRDFERLIQTGRMLCTADGNRAVSVLAHCGLLLRELRRPAEALGYFYAARIVAGIAVENLPDWFFSELSGAYMDQQDWKLALEAASAGVTRKPALYLTAAMAQLKLGHVPGARASLDAAITALGGQHAKARAVSEACEALLAADPSEESRSLVYKAQAAFPLESRLSLQQADLAFAAGDWRRTALICAQIAAEPGAMTAPSLQRLTAAVRKMPELHAEFLPAFQRAVTSQAENQELVFRFYEYLTICDGHENAVERLAAFQAQELHLLPALALELARWGRLSWLQANCGRQIGAWRCSAAFQDCSAFLDALCVFGPVEETLLKRVRAMTHSRWRLFCLFRLPSLRSVRVRGAKQTDAALLAEAGVDAGRLDAFLERLTSIQLPEYDAYLETAEIASPEARRRIRVEEQQIAFQDTVIRDQRFDMLDPMTGEAAELFDSVKIFDRQIFSFRGKEFLMFISGGNMNAGIFIYLVRANLLLRTDTLTSPCSQSYYGSEVHMAELVAVYLERAARHFGKLLTSVAEASRRAGRPRKVVVIHGRAENPAHHIWNYLSPFERLNMASLLDKISMVVRPPTEYFGTVKEIFPELGHAELLSLPERAAIDPFPFSPDHVVIQLGGNFIPKTLRRRVHRWALGQVPPDSLNTIGALARRRHPIIWLGMRVGDKVWTNQVDGLVEVINDLCAEHPTALFLLDGFSLPFAAAGVPSKWGAAVEELRTLAEKICAGVLRPDAVLSLIGNTLAESVLWAMQVDCYFAPLGSSQHKVGWYCDAPGIVYTTTKSAVTPPALRPGAWEAEGSPVPEFIVGEVASAGRRRGHFDFRVNLDNVDFSPSVVVDSIRRLLQGSTPHRASALQALP